jgi:hypothetical protein
MITEIFWFGFGIVFFRWFKTEMKEAELLDKYDELKK